MRSTRVGLFNVWYLIRNRILSSYPALTRRGKYIQWGERRRAPTYSNLPDCRRFNCPPYPWHWATHWILERAQLTGNEVVCDLGAGTNPIMIKAYQKGARLCYLMDNMFLPSDQDMASNMQRIQGDASCLPLDDGSIDVIISVSVLEHLPISSRLTVMREIERVLKPGGRALISIGHFLNTSDEAWVLMRELPFFTDRGCAVYLPIDLRQLVEAAPRLNLAATDDIEFFPGYETYRETSLLQDPYLCTDAFHDYPEITRYPFLDPVLVCEIGIMLLKN